MEHLTLIKTRSILTDLNLKFIDLPVSQELDSKSYYEYPNLSRSLRVINLPFKKYNKELYRLKYFLELDISANSYLNVRDVAHNNSVKILSYLVGKDLSIRKKNVNNQIYQHFDYENDYKLFEYNNENILIINNFIEVLILDVLNSLKFNNNSMIGIFSLFINCLNYRNLLTNEEIEILESLKYTIYMILTSGGQREEFHILDAEFDIFNYSMELRRNIVNLSDDIFHIYPTDMFLFKDKSKETIIEYLDSRGLNYTINKYKSTKKINYEQ